ncbi:MAG TPA: hypothetical protein ENJ00_02335 [Phycisphaerales bacterium]|nr:hypothetical protein [Phycisphaerales bacterium]
MNQNALEQVNQIVAAIQEHPLWSQSGLIVLLIAGVLLWVSGRRVLKPIFAVLGALAGGFLGHTALPAVGIDHIFGLTGDVAGAAVGGTLGALAAILIFRVAIGVLAAAVVGGLAVLGASIFVQTRPVPPPAQNPSSPLVESRPAESPSEADQLSPDTLTLGDANDAIREPGKFASDLYRGIKAEVWDPLSTSDRALLTASGLAGIVAGLALGVLAPKKSTALVTAFAGAGMWLPATYFLSQALTVPGRALLERTPIEWLVIWFGVALTGLFIQWRGLTDRRKPKRSRRDDDDDDEDDRDED